MVKRLITVGERAKIIAQTAYGVTGDMENIIASGFDDYIIKPIMSQALVEKIIQNLAQKKH